MSTILAPLGTGTGQFLFTTGIRALLRKITGLPGNQAPNSGQRDGHPIR